MATVFDYVQLETDIFGLKFKPSIPSMNDLDWIDWIRSDTGMKSIQYRHQLINPEFSSRNKKLLFDVMKELEADGKLHSILEIGVNRSREESSTRVILDNKPDNVKYFGIDLAEHNLSMLRDESKNVFCLATNSSNYEEIMNFCKSKGTDSFSLVFIDGWHSVNQCCDDWRFVKNLEVGGYALGHDTNSHPGPSCLYEAIDEEVFQKKKHFTEFEDEDWGMFTAKRLENK